MIVTTEIIAATPTIIPRRVSTVRSLLTNKLLAESRKIDQPSMSEESFIAVFLSLPVTTILIQIKRRLRRPAIEVAESQARVVHGKIP
jgi:hypothetical protein